MFKKKQNVEALFRTSFCLFMGFSRQEYWSGLPFPSPILWSPDAKNWLIGKDPDAGKDWRQEEKGVTEDETVGWHHQLNGHEFEPAPGVGDGQGRLACCSPWGCKESDTIEQLNCTVWNKFDFIMGHLGWYLKELFNAQLSCMLDDGSVYYYAKITFYSQ